MKKKVFVIIGVIVIICILLLGIVYLVDLDRMKNNKPVLFSTWGRKYHEPVEIETDLDLVLSLEDEITANSAWCGTFNLLWNDLKNNLAKQDIVFEEESEIVNNLNKGTFTEDNLSDENYYKVYGTPSEKLKEQIKREIDKKFNEKSNILDSFDWQNVNEEDYILYSMLKKEFEFPEKFIELDNGKFANYDNVKYFGINADTEEKIREKYEEQVEVLYYNSEDSFAIKLKTKENDEVIIAKGNKSKTFGAMYENILDRANDYAGPKHLMIEESLKIPNINFNMNEEINEVENKKFKFSNGLDYEIKKAIQTIQFELNSKGGKVKSESGIFAANMSAEMMLDRPRQFVVDDNFTVFLVEKNKNLPYFAANISDISMVQNDVIKVSDEEKNSIVTIEQTITEENKDKFEPIVITDEAKEIEKLIYNLKFTELTCDGLGVYNIKLDNGERYGLEIYNNICHITAGGRGEAVLTSEQSRRLLEIIDKYTMKNVAMDIKDETN